LQQYHFVMFDESSRSMRPVILYLFSDRLVVQGIAEYALEIESIDLARLLAVHCDAGLLQQLLATIDDTSSSQAASAECT